MKKLLMLLLSIIMFMIPQVYSEIDYEINFGILQTVVYKNGELDQARIAVTHIKRNAEIDMLLYLDTYCKYMGDFVKVKCTKDLCTEVVFCDNTQIPINEWEMKDFLAKTDILIKNDQSRLNCELITYARIQMVWVNNPFKVSTIGKVLSACEVWTDAQKFNQIQEVYNSSEYLNNSLVLEDSESMKNYSNIWSTITIFIIMSIFCFMD